MIHVVIRQWICPTIILFLSACATSADINDKFAEKNRLLRSEHHHSLPVVVYRSKRSTGSQWHIYIEGDGRPWLRPDTVANDPVTKKPLMLRLMLKDPSPSIYLGRPCYNQHATKNVCHPYFWTHGRYSEEVVSSLSDTLKQLISQYHISKLTLIGHSGGGTLAMLLAERIRQTSAVVTLAGNLDINAWADEHGYSRLLGSLNPAERKPIPNHIRQYHFLGGNDQMITESMISPLISRQENSKLYVLKDYGHDCCWHTDWHLFLEKL